MRVKAVYITGVFYLSLKMYSYAFLSYHNIEAIFFPTRTTPYYIYILRVNINYTYTF